MATYRRRRAACPQGPTYCTYWVRVPASAVPYVPRTVAPQVLGGAASMLGCRLNLTLSSFATDCTRRAAPAGAPGACTFPPTVNHAAGWAEARRAALRLVDAEDVIEVPPTMGSEIDGSPPP